MAVTYLPGEILDVGTSNSTQIVGYGIEKRDDQLVTCQAGLLKTHNKKMWLSVQSKRYIPQTGDRIIGVVTGKQGDLFKLDIGSADQGFISFLAFEGATKRNRPNLKTGDLLYAQVIQASKHLEPELTCIDSVSRAKGLGSLSGGLLFKVSLHLARRLLSPNCQVLELLGKNHKFEITIGLNGRVWLNGSSPKEVILLRNVITGSEYVLDGDVSEYVERLLKTSNQDSGAAAMDTS